MSLSVYACRGASSARSEQWDSVIGWLRVYPKLTIRIVVPRQHAPNGDSVIG